MLRIRTFVLSVPAFGVLSASAGASETCLIDKARYAIPSRPDLSLQFRRRGRVLDLVLRSAETKRSYWFALNQGNGRDGITLIPIEDPGRAGDRNPKEWPGRRDDPPSDSATHIFLYTLNARLQVSDMMPEPKQPAPKFVFVPELRPAFWYDGGVFSAEPLPATTREDIPRAFFRRKCI